MHINLRVVFYQCKNADKSSLFLYPKVKGDNEYDLSAIGFERLSIFRPGFLETETERPRRRLLEEWVIKTVKAIGYTSIVVPVSQVAKAMLKVATSETTEGIVWKKNEKGTEFGIMEHADIVKVGKDLTDEVNNNEL